eukprot:TRINITY_DN9015_c0_g2_i1.p1 TRINITY_DN9015_c0_g2~~TRINITY_DN9015_c0_g2_i1.p1  ORF type:complete len:278 (+),score=12.70 TRINITY_DN9015_c0_g2_i1:24-836(+)
MGYLSCAFLWGLYYYKSKSSVVTFQRLLLGIMVCKLLELALSVAYYETYSATGYALLSIRIILHVLKVVAQISLMMVILSISIGWWITGRTPALRERQICWGAFIVYAVFVALYEFCEDPLTLCFAYLLSLQVVKGLFTIGTGMAISANIGQLRNLLDDDSTLLDDPQDLQWKMKALGTLLWVIPFYLLFPIALLCLQFTVLYWHRSWVVIALNELLFQTTLFMIIYTLSPQPHHHAYSAQAALREPQAQLHRSASLPQMLIVNRERQLQ